MNVPISIVIPTLADEDLLGAALAALASELRSRDCCDEVIVVDDSGHGALTNWLAEHWPDVVHLVNPKNLGFAESVLAGARLAKHADLFLMNPDVHVRAGSLEFLQGTLRSDANIYSVSPYVLLNGDDDSPESLPELVVELGIPRIERMDVDVVPGERAAAYPDGIPVAFALGGACLLRRDEFLDSPFDPRFAPFYWEDVDQSQVALNSGRQVLVDPRAVVEHHHRGTVGRHVPDALVRAAIEKNRMRFAWKHFDGSELESNLNDLGARALEHALAEEREELLWLALALDEELS
jgi:GT2 family glycosyltransferase